MQLTEPGPSRTQPICPACLKPLKRAGVMVARGMSTTTYIHADDTACKREQPAEQLDPTRAPRLPAA